MLLTAGRWPWKSESAKECVTTHLPKQPALKMDGALASGPYSTVEAVLALARARMLSTSREVQGCAWKGFDVNLPGAAPGTDLGGSSKYLSEILKD